jgi:pre-mRNA-splicing factor SYF1
MISKNPEKVHSLKVEPIIRQGIKRYTDQTGLLWNSLADYYTRSGLFEKVNH